MLTPILAIIGFTLLGMAIAKDETNGALIGALIGIIAGVVLGAVIGGNFPLKTTIVASQPIEQMIIDSQDEGTFYLVKDESEHVFIYRINGVDTTVDAYEVEVIFEAGVTPYVEYTKTQHDFPKGRGWMVAFGFSRYPQDSIVVHIPQGMMYFK